MAFVVSENEQELALIGGPFDGCTLTGRGLPLVLIVGSLSTARLLDAPSEEHDGVLCRYVASFDGPMRYEFTAENQLTWDIAL